MRSTMRKITDSQIPRFFAKGIWKGAQGFRGSHRSISYYLCGEPGSLRFRGRRLFEMRVKKMFAK